MRIAITAVLLAASIVLTALSVTTLPFYDGRSGEVEPLVWHTLALWVLFGLSVLALRGVTTRAAVALVIAGSLGIGGAAILGPPNTSTDSARYAWDGIVQNAGHSPYTYVPADPALDELKPEWLFPAPVVGADGELECVGSRVMTSNVPGTDEIVCTTINRGKVPTIYPPTSELTFAAVRALVPPEAEYWPMQVLGLLTSLAITGLLLRALVVRGRDPRWAALWGWCPLVATEGVTNSHIDIVSALLLLVATLLVAQGKPLRGGLALGASIGAKLIPVIGAPALLGRRPGKVITASIAVFALLYVPYVIASGIGVLGYLPGYLSEEGYETGTRFVLLSLILPGLPATIVAALLVLAVGLLVWWKADTTNPWVWQVVMIGTTLLIVSPRYPWYALLLVPMIAMTGRWEWLLVPLALTERLLFADVGFARLTLALAIVVIVAVSLHRAGPGAVTRLQDTIRHPVRYLRERPADQSSTSA